MLQNTLCLWNIITFRFYSHILFLERDFFLNIYILHPFLVLYSNLLSYIFLSLFSISIGDSKTCSTKLHACDIYHAIFLSNIGFRIVKKTHLAVSARFIHSWNRCLMEISCNQCQILKQYNEEFKAYEGV